MQNKSGKKSNKASLRGGAAQQSLAADGAIACFLSNFFPFSLNGDRAPQLKAIVIMDLLLSVKDVKKTQRLNYENLHKAVIEAQVAAPNRNSASRGLDVPQTYLDEWKSKLNELLK
jgi:hypothetical protein